MTEDLEGLYGWPGAELVVIYIIDYKMFTDSLADRRMKW